MIEMSQSVEAKVNPYEMFLPRQVEHINEVDDGFFPFPFVQIQQKMQISSRSMVGARFIHRRCGPDVAPVHRPQRRRQVDGETCGILRSGRMERLLPGHSPRFQEAAD